MPPNVITFDDYELDAEGFELRRGGALVAMEPQVFEVLAYLVQHHDRVVSKDEIIGHVWPDGFISDSALHTRLMAARKAIGDTGKEQRLIRTVRGRGFRFVGQVLEGGGRQPETDALDSESPTAAQATVAAAEPLDVAATSFLGREGEIERLLAMVERPGCRLITLVGPGGMGKTRLAARLANRLVEAGREVVTISLVSITTDDELRVAIARGLGLSTSDTSAPAIAERIGSREAVLVLDNFEQLVQEGARSLAVLVARAPSLRVVVTSREVLGLQEEWLFPVGGLACEETGGAAPPAARLFLEREAQAGIPEPGIDPAVLDICRLVEGMPLAIELAASLRRYMTRQDIAANLRQGIEVLESDLRNAPDRHRTITGLFDETCRHLTAPQLGTLLALSVFEDAFSAEDAMHVTGTAPRALAELVSRSLVQVRQDRFVLHPLLRQYARSRAGSTYERYQGDHAEYFAGYLGDRRDRLEAGDQAAAAAEVDARLPNILAAWRWACEQGRLDLLAAAAYPLFLYARLRSLWAEVRPAIERGIQAAEADGEDGWRTQAELAIYLAWARIRTSLGEGVAEAYRTANALYRAHEALPPPGLGTDTLALRAFLHWGGGDYPGMARSAEEARGRARGRGDALGEAFALWLGAVANNRVAALRWDGSPDGTSIYRPADEQAEATLREAQWQLDRATVLLASRGERAFTSSVLHERAWNAKAFGDAAAAIKLGRQCYEIRKEFGDRRGMADALLELAGSYLIPGDRDAARASCDEAEPILRRLGEEGGISELERTLAMEATWRGDLDAAMTHAARAIELSLQIGSVNNVLGSVRLVGDVLRHQGDMDGAAEIHAFVVAHPGSPPFARARSVAALGEEAAALSLPVDVLVGRAAGMDLTDFAMSVLARYGPSFPRI